MIYIIFFFSGYILGSLPIGFLLVSKLRRIDLSSSGSGNVGGFNAYDVTKSRSIGTLVVLIDGLKGLIAALFAGSYFHGTFLIEAIALSGAVIGHNYPIWLRFKGGRGIATTCGGLFAIGVSYTIVWSLIWLVAYKARQDILKANVIAIIATPILIFLLPERTVQLLNMGDIPANQYMIFGVVLSLILLASHWRPMLDLFGLGKRNEQYRITRR